MHCSAPKVLFLFLQKPFPRFPTFSSRFKRETRKMWSSRAPGIWIPGFWLSLPTSLQCLHLRAVRRLLLMRSLTDATELYLGMELHISAFYQTKLNCELKSIKKQLVFSLNSGFSAEKKFHREHILTFCKLQFYWKRSFRWEPRAVGSSRAP